MDKQLEQRIRDRAYELWRQHGSQPGRADEYWYQAEREVLGADAGAAGDLTGGPAGSSDSSSEREGAPASVDINAAPLGMTSETTDEAQAGAEGAAPAKARKRRTAAAKPDEVGAAPQDAPKRRRPTRVP